MESSAKKMVTAEEFDAAVKQVIHDQVRCYFRKRC